MTRRNTRLSGEILKLAKNVQDLASAFNGNVHSILRQQRDDREQLHAFYGNMEKALAGVLGRMDALERNGLPKVDQPPLGEMKAAEPLPRFYVVEHASAIGTKRWFVLDRERKRNKSKWTYTKIEGGDSGIITAFIPEDTSDGAARAAAKEYCAWLNKMEDDKVPPVPSPVVKTTYRNIYAGVHGAERNCYGGYESKADADAGMGSFVQRLFVERVDTHADGTTSVHRC